MIVLILSLFLFLTFIVLGGFHFYWLFGGDWGLSKVFPTKINEAGNKPIPKFATLIVALILSLFGLIYLIKSGLVAFYIPSWAATYGYWFIPGIFILRAIGEFNYVGFFKKVKNTEFAMADSKIFAPLCLGIGLIGLTLQFLN